MFQSRFHPTLSTRPDLIGLVCFSTSSTVLASPSVASSGPLSEAVRTLHQKVGGSTNIAAGLRDSGAILRGAPKGFRKRIWLLSDGEVTTEKSAVIPTAEALRSAFVNINCIGFGDRYDREVLERISATTHNGKFFQVSDIGSLTTAIMSGTRNRNIATKPEATVFCIDVSGSMSEPMGNTTKIATVEAALMGLLEFKRWCFS